MATSPRIGVTEREVMRVTFESDSVLPVQSVAAMVGCGTSRVYATYVKYGVSIPRKLGVHNNKGRCADSAVETRRRESIRKTLTGRTRPAETVAKISAAVKRQHQLGAYDTSNKRKREPEERSKIASSLIEAYANGLISFSHVKSESATHNGIRMRSKLEATFAKMLDEAGTLWQYEPKVFKLSWCTYRPDFYLPETDTWVECKGYMDKTSERKVKSFREETGKTLSVVWFKEVFNGC